MLTIACIMLRDLNAIAPLVTMFFHITYSMINVVVLFESSLGLVSYRPTLRVPRLVPAVGLTGCLFSMFIINPSFSLLSVAMVAGLYLFIRTRTKGRTDIENPRSNVFTAFAEWAAARVSPEDRGNARGWKPHLLVPTHNPERLRGSFPLLLDLVMPEGSVNLLGVPTFEGRADLQARLVGLTEAFREQGILASSSVVTETDFARAVTTGLEALQSAFFRPNVLFTQVPHDPAYRAERLEVMARAQDNGVGVMLYCPHPEAGLGRRRDINLWVRGHQCWQADAAFAAGNLDLLLLIGFRLSRVWRGTLRLMVVIPDASAEPAAAAFLEELCDLARLPSSVQRVVRVGAFHAELAAAPVADLSLLGLPKEAPDLDELAALVRISRGACLFVADAGHEDARA